MIGVYVRTARADLERYPAWTPEWNDALDALRYWQAAAERIVA
jgi:hypothetical protein